MIWVYHCFWKHPYLGRKGTTSPQLDLATQQAKIGCSGQATANWNLSSGDAWWVTEKRRGPWIAKTKMWDSISEVRGYYWVIRGIYNRKICILFNFKKTFFFEPPKRLIWCICNYRKGSCVFNPLSGTYRIQSDPTLKRISLWKPMGFHKPWS